MLVLEFGARARRLETSWLVTDREFAPLTRRKFASAGHQWPLLPQGALKSSLLLLLLPILGRPALVYHRWRANLFTNRQPQRRPEQMANLLL